LRAVIFDFDGVLVNSEPLHFRSLRECLMDFGVAIDEEEYLRHYLAYDDRGALRLAFERHGVPFDRARLQAAAQTKARIFRQLMPEIPFFPGARELVRALAGELPLAIASGAQREEIEAILEAGGVRDAFKAVVGAGDVRSSKPHPEPYLAAVSGLARWATGLQPEACLAFEDSMPGIAAARAAGMKVIGVSNTYPPAKLSAADRVVDTLSGLDVTDLRRLFD
jgi:HAD superfamily hydrolase (TIGR01509 family)